MTLKSRLTITLHNGVIFSWLMAWLFITAMPVIHSHSTSLSPLSSHCPIASMQMFDDKTMSEPLPSSDAQPQVSQFYHCPLCHSDQLLFAPLPFQFSVLFSATLSFSDFLYLPTSLTFIFKMPRSPPVLARHL